MENHTEIIIGEIWRDVFDFDNYEVSSEGRVRNKKSKRILIPQKQTNGYRHVTLSDRNRKLTILVHRLVAEHFLPADQNPANVCVNHKNGIKTDNALRNLEYISYSENMRHSYAIGLREAQREASRLRRAKLSEIDIRNIRQRYEDGESQTSIAGSYNVSQSNIFQIVNGNTWSNIQ